MYFSGTQKAWSLNIGTLALDPTSPTRRVQLRFWDDLAGLAERQLRKGMRIVVCGRPEVNTYTGKDGITRTTFAVRAHGFWDSVASALRTG